MIFMFTFFVFLVCFLLSIQPVKLFLNRNVKVPKSFSWSKYLERRKAQAAPEKLFPGRFPEVKNGFRPGMKLEAIDPEHQSLFCVMTVAEVQGIFIFFRILLNL